MNKQLLNLLKQLDKHGAVIPNTPGFKTADLNKLKSLGVVTDSLDGVVVTRKGRAALDSA